MAIVSSVTVTWGWGSAPFSWVPSVPFLGSWFLSFVDPVWSRPGSSGMNNLRVTWIAAAWIVSWGCTIVRATVATSEVFPRRTVSWDGTSIFFSDSVSVAV